ncbi:MAG: hypothetical protein KAU94_09585 [Verrucomicrobia bacterium]|nr:hypothetical protein [Verrucomicrobiota bacterium]
MGSKLRILAIGLFVLCGAVLVLAQESNKIALLSMEPVAGAKTEQPTVTAVYGVSADDYLPSIDALKRQARPNVRSAASHPAFDLPSAFYFIGGPIFILLFLRVLVIFLNGFEEKRREEQRQAVLDVADPE